MGNRSKAHRNSRSEMTWGYIMVAPTIIGLLVLNIYPFIDTIKLSFSKTLPFGLYELRGAENYIEMFASPEFWRANLNTLYFCLLTVPVGIFLALIVAVMLNAKIKGQSAFRAIFFLPMVVAPAAVAMVWKWMFNTEYGIINSVIGSKISWITDPNIIMVTCAIVAIWSSIGYDAVLLLSGLQNISKSYYEAASLDGAQRFIKAKGLCETALYQIDGSGRRYSGALLMSAGIPVPFELKEYEAVQFCLTMAGGKHDQ